MEEGEKLSILEVNKRVWDHIKREKLQDPNNKRNIIPDEKMKPVFGKKTFSMFQIGKKLKDHVSRWC